jgi:hypothetical protein
MVGCYTVQNNSLTTYRPNIASSIRAYVNQEGKRTKERKTETKRERKKETKKERKKK